MGKTIASGVWPTMITPFTLKGEVDYDALERLVEWYIGHGVQGLFAVCQSSEMFYLTLEERISVARFVKEKAAGRVQVIASGHISDELADQIEELKQMAATGVDAVVIVSNRLAKAEEDDSVWIGNAQKLLDAVPDIPFGVYECPYPYKRLLSPDTLKWCASTGRFLFLKDTSCDIGQMKAKLEAVAGSELKLFNANSTTLLESLKLGAAGFSGVMANFHPDLYVQLIGQWRQNAELAERLQSFLTVASLIELQVYPVNAKYHLRQLGLPIETVCRVRDDSALKGNHRMEVEQLEKLGQTVKRLLFQEKESVR
ncbi:Putative 2-dehydro-3-deoxy-D-gluconate aldolase YagE [Paenibacillus solanacearum]|uniref:2-dehydro-3-deoxy-D-gluconate aldolase YagE n=2 Tax=Paenibacillus solanacearum TaxID=2048548 RepID=A0A916K0D3_9BACL|nr:dihydrodipicolinate synthase family protein [Paenibacillus solanacearum]CAG7614892.1 Putative 2-dehydro-3-deoxy-D-gluconate aldolase YagE [Paenibacillus solanacearum]